MRYLILLILSCTLMFSCGTESKPTATKTKTAAKRQKAKKVKVATTKTTAKRKKAKKVKTATADSEVRYLNFIKRKVGLNNAQIKSVKKIRRKYVVKMNSLKKDKRWKGKAKKALLAKKNADLKGVIGKSWSKWEVANRKWAKIN